MKFTYITVCDRTKLNWLQRDAFALHWPHLEQQHWCEICKQPFTGHSVRLLKDPGGHVHLECGTQGCTGTPAHWAPFPWWDPQHPLTRTRLALDPSTPGGVEPSADMEDFLLRTAPVTDACCGAPRSPLTPWEDGEERAETEWTCRLERLGDALRNDQRYELCWNCFLEDFISRPGFARQSHREDPTHLKAVLLEIVRRIFRAQAGEQDVLVMRLAGQELLHGVVRTHSEPHLFFYLEHLDYGFMRPALDTSGKTRVARFRMAQGLSRDWEHPG